MMGKGDHSLLRIACLSLALLLGSLMGCSDRTDVPVARTYQAYISNSVRTSMADNGDVSWTEGDKIWYYSQDGGELRSHVTEEGGAKIDIPLTLASDATFVTAVYGTSSISEHTFASLELGNVVKPVQEGTFVDGHAAVARLTDINGPTLHFYNLVSYIVFSTALTRIDHVVFSAADDTPLHANGNVDVHFEDDVPVPALSGNGGNSIRTNLRGSGTYCIAVLPVTLSKGFVLTCYDSQDKVIGTATGRNPLSVNRGSLVKLGIIDSHLVDEDGMHLSGYDGDDSWDYSGDTGGEIGLGGYGNDYYWGSGSGNTQFTIGAGWYSTDYDWDSTSGSSGDILKEGYGDDRNWN